MDFPADENKNEAMLVILDEDGNESADPRDLLIFPFYPESLSDSKAITYSNKEYPGASAPLYQYVSSGERTLTFSAFFLQESRNLNDSQFNVDVNAALLWLRSNLYPDYDSSGRTIAPPVLRLYMGGYAFYGQNTPDGLNGVYTIPCILTSCDIEVTKWWDGAYGTDPKPKSATASITLQEIVNYKGQVTLPTRERDFGFPADKSRSARRGRGARVFNFKPVQVKATQVDSP